MSDLTSIPFKELKREYIRRIRQQAAAKRKKRSGGGRPRTVEHCPCDRYSLAVAAKRNHKCVAPS